jgi:hypothetical protein
LLTVSVTVCVTVNVGEPVADGVKVLGCTVGDTVSVEVWVIVALTEGLAVSVDVCVTVDE